METINLKINGIEVTAPKGSTILEAARLAHIEIPTLCFLKEINEIGACRICIVELKNGKIVTSCVYPAEEGMEVFTNTPRVMDSRKKTLQLLLSNHNRSCLSCVRSGHCELQELAKELGVDDESYYDGEVTPSEIDTSAAAAWQSATRYRASASSAPTTAASTPRSALPSVWAWVKPPAYPAASVSLSVLPALFRKRIKQTMYSRRSQIPLST